MHDVLHESASGAAESAQVPPVQQRLLYVICKNYFAREFGGSREVRHRVSVMRDLGYAITVIHADNPHADVDGAVGGRGVEFIQSSSLFDLSMKRYVSPARWARHLRARGELRQQIREQRPLALLVHGERPLRFYVDLQDLLPVVFFRHDSSVSWGKPWREVWNDPWHAAEKPLRRFVSLTLRWWEAKRLRRFRHFVVNSQYMHRIHNVPDAIVQPPPLIGSTGDVLDFSQRTPGSLVFAGRLEAAKGALDAVRILAALPAPFHLTMLGEGPLRGACKRLADELGCGDRLRIVGWVAGDAVRDAMKRAWLTLVPSLVDESFSLVALESLSCGTPVVAYESGAIAELIGRRTGAVVGRGDAAAASETVKQICIDPLTWSHYSRQCIEAAIRFSPRDFRGSMEALLQRVVPTSSVGEAK